MGYKILLFFLFLLLDIYIGRYIFLQLPIVNGQSSPKIDTNQVRLEAQKIADDCKSKVYKETCYASAFARLTNKTDMEFAKKALFTLQDIDPQQAIGCHLIAHYISSAETKKNPTHWVELLGKQDSNLCSGGFIHGVLEAHMSADPTFTLDAKQFPIICSVVKDGGRGRLSCNHNLGHLLLVDTSFSIPKALSICNEIPEQDARYECLSGVFMENLTRLNLVAHNLAKAIPWDVQHTKEVEQLCRQYNGLEAKACWKEISYMYSTTNNTDPIKLFAACNKTPTKDTAKECYIYGIGNMISFPTFNFANLNKLCTVYDETNPLFKTCAYHVVGSLMSSSPKFSNNTVAFCNDTPWWFQEDCFRQMGGKLKLTVTSVEERAGFCKAVPDQYKLLCTDS